LNSVETTVTIMVDVTVEQIGVVSVLFSHAELGHTALTVAALFWLALIQQASCFFKNDES
jgi:hypothetical protein